MSVSILVPVRTDGQARADAWHYVSRYYRDNFPDWELVAGVCELDDWSKGSALQDAYRHASGDVFVIADADSFVEPSCLVEAVAEARRGNWVVPHRTVYRLTEAETTRLYDGGAPRRGPGLVVREPYTGPPGGGIVVLQRAAWELVGGIDPRFKGWGGEDVSFGWALEALVGWHCRLVGRLFHLWHPHPAPDLRGSPESEELVARYKAARNDRAAMVALIDEFRDVASTP